jgi:hypothetical protein
MAKKKNPPISPITNAPGPMQIGILKIFVPGMSKNARMNITVPKRECKNKFKTNPK